MRAAIGPLATVACRHAALIVAQQAETKDRRDGQPSRVRHHSTRGGTAMSHATHEAVGRLSICVENTFICHNIHSWARLWHV